MALLVLVRTPLLRRGRLLRRAARRLRRGEGVGQLLYVRQIALAFHPRYGLELVGASLRLQRRILREAQLERRRC